MPKENFKTLRKIINEYLDEQKERLASSTFRNYEDALGWLLTSLARESYTFLDEKKIELYEKQQEAGVEFEDFFGADVLDGSAFADFLGYFLPRKTFVGFESAKKICGIILHFYNWLVEKGYIQNEGDEVWTAKDLREDFKQSWAEHEKFVSNLEI